MTGVLLRASIGTIGILAVALIVLFKLPSDQQASASHAGGMDAMSIDMDTAGNTVTNLATREKCGEVGPGSSLTFDVTGEAIPPYELGFPYAQGGVIGFSFALGYDEVAL